jgi:hypothetical protein
MAALHASSVVPRTPPPCWRHTTDAHLPARVHKRPQAQEALLCGFDFIVAPLVRPEHRPPAPGPPVNAALPLPFARDDVLYLGSSQWTRQVRN